MTQATFLKSESAGGNFFSRDRNSESLRKLILVVVKHAVIQVLQYKARVISCSMIYKVKKVDEVKKLQK